VLLFGLGSSVLSVLAACVVAIPRLLLLLLMRVLVVIRQLVAARGLDRAELLWVGLWLINIDFLAIEEAAHVNRARVLV